jgi:cell wall-associated NlpC family hydrolase
MNARFSCALRLLLCCAVASVVPGSVQAQATLPKPFAKFSTSAAALRDSVAALARAQVGTRYRFGGTSPDRGFDCSGLVRFVASALGLELPRTAHQQAHVGFEVVKDSSFLRPGDLLTFGRGSRVTHVGIYVGDGRFVHASSVAGRVVESRIDRPVSGLVRPWTGIRRVILASDTATARPGG